MPIYAFKCNDCGHKFEKFFFKMTHKKDPACPECKSSNTTKEIGSVNSRMSDHTSSSNSSCLPKFGFG